MENKYPDHLFDETRRQVAVSYIRHELRKLFPSLHKDSYFQDIDQDIAKWFSDNSTLTPVRDFWNGLHGISMGFRLKNIVTRVTSKNIIWERRVIPVSNIKFGATFDELSVVGHKPTVEQVREWYFDSAHTDALAEARVAHLQRSQETAPRDLFPIIVQTTDSLSTVIDGNRRLLKAIVEKRDTIEAFVGTQIANPPFVDSWVPTSSLLELVSEHRYWAKLGRDTTKAVAGVISELIRDSSVGKMELINRCVDVEHNEADKVLMQEINKLSPIL